MSILFPSEDNGGILPNTILVPVSEKLTADPVVRQKMDAGQSKQRQRYTAVSKTINCRLQLTNSQHAAFMTFFETTTKYGSLEFEWINFDTGASANYRFMGIPSRDDDGIYSSVSFVLERLP